MLFRIFAVVFIHVCIISCNSGVGVTEKALSQSNTPVTNVLTYPSHDQWKDISAREDSTDSDLLVSNSQNEETSVINDNIAEQEKSESKKGKEKTWIRSPQETNVAQVRVGQDEFLELQSVRAVVSVEGIRARTVVDHVFHNPYQRTLEGDFRYKLPDHASICYFAFYPDGVVPQRLEKNHELPDLPSAAQVYNRPVTDYFLEENSVFGRAKIAHAVPQQKALAAYEAVVRRGVDPALVEWAGGNNFTTRVFPLLPNKSYRIVIAYEQTLPSIDNIITYNFSFAKVASEFMLVADKHYVENPQLNIKSSIEQNTHWISYKTTANDQQITFRASLVSDFITNKDPKQGITYTYGSISPQFTSEYRASRSGKAVFMLDTSLSQEKKEFGMYISLLENILEKNEDIKEFNVLFFDVSSGWLQQGWIPNNSSGLSLFKNKTQMVALEGATNIDQALQRLVTTPWINQINTNIDVFFLSNGQHNWGEVSLRKSVKRFRQVLQFSPHFYCYNLGLGTANLELFHLLNEFGGGSFASSMQLDKLAVAHRRSTLFVEEISGIGIEDVMIAGNIKNIYPGQQIIVAGKVINDKPMINITGRVAGIQKTLSFEIPVKNSGSLAPRAFAELAVRQMESLDDPSLEEAIIAYSRYFSIPGKTCSLLMLESQDDYDEFEINLQKDSQKIENTRVIQLFSQAEMSLSNSVSSEKQSFLHFWKTLQENELVKIESKQIDTLLTQLDESNFSFSLQQLPYTFPGKQPAKENYTWYLKKAQKYSAQDNLTGYMRALSSVVELQPQESTALRVAGYLLLKEKIASHAVSVFRRVRDKRPFEPQAYRDLAKSYATLGKNEVAALYYEILLAGNWDQRFRQIKTIAQEEYLQILRRIAVSDNSKIKIFSQQRLQKIQKLTPASTNDITVTITWSTNDTDVDLRVVEPSGEKCYYENLQTRSGGKLLADVTQGYGPERYTLKKATQGKYKIYVQYFRGNQNRISDITFVETTVSLNSGSSQANTFSFYTMLSSSKEKKLIKVLGW
ncbi:hypothetical protein [Candidatus Uabimicrobium sp. HlEnr_7]|uniref:hypothetical protein n=1 Tax=Candidatus Uabimicrobium helgolandensis TaxID=3095367 RepID=UPI003558A0FA